MASILFTFGAAAVTAIIYLLTSIIYNLYFHPLAKFSGPPIWCMLRLPYLHCMLAGQLPFTTKTLHDQYGPVVRLAPDELAFSDPAAWKDIYQRQTLDRPPQWTGKPPGVVHDNFISAPASEHARLRKAFNPAFSDKASREYEPIATRYINVLIEKFRSSVSAGEDNTFDLVKWLNYLEFDTIMDLGWGDNFDCLGTERYSPWISFVLLLKEKLIGVSIAYFPWLNALTPYIMPPSAKKQIDDLLDICKSKTEARLAKRDNTERRDFFSNVLSEKASASNVSSGEMDQAALTLIVAGSEPTTSGLVGTINCLLGNADKLAVLQQEVRSSFKYSQDITGAATSELSYLNAVIKEGLRLCPPLPANLPRLVPSPGLNIAGVYVPGGTTVSTGAWVQSQSSANFSHPTEFLPERWLNDSGEFAKDRKEAFQPFSLGQRNCIGQSLAWLELRLVLAHLIWNFDISVPGGKTLPLWNQQAILWSWEKAPLLTKLTLRG